MKLLLMGDMAATGFGTVTMDLGRALLARGIDVRFLATAQTELPEPFDSRTARLDGPWFADPATAQDRFEHLYTGGLFEDGWTPDTAILTGDPGSAVGNPLLTVTPKGFPLWHYCPIEGIDLPPAWGSIWRIAKPIAMCEFGAAEIERATGTRPPFVYHGVDTDVFREASGLRPLVVDHKILRSKADCRAVSTVITLDRPQERFGIPPEATVLLRTDAYWPRKAYPSMFRAVMPVLATHPDVVLVVHCGLRGPGGDIRVELSKYGELAKRVMLTGVGSGYQAGRLSREAMVALYNAADVYLSTGPEGFGLTIAEALACGTPAVGLDFSAVPEVIGPGGTVVPVGALVDSIYSYFWATPNERLYAEAVDFLVTHKHRREELGMLGAMHVRAKFSWSKAAEQFETILEERTAAMAA